MKTTTGTATKRYRAQNRPETLNYWAAEPEEAE